VQSASEVRPTAGVLPRRGNLMATVQALPTRLREQLSQAVSRVRRLRLIRGASALAVVLLTTAAACLLADYVLHLPATARGVMLAAWLAIGLGTAHWALLRPAIRRIDLDALAAVIEEKYPDLNERLTSTVELSECAQGFHGSPELIAIVMNETEARVARL